MKKHLFFSIALFTGLIAISQKEIFDIASYTPPKDWKKDAKPGVVNYTNVKSTAGKFCVITIYASKASTGDAQNDFNNEWKELVLTPYKGEANPKTETQVTTEGWKVLSAAAQTKLDGNDFYVILTVVSGFGKSMTIRTSLNDASYTTEVDTFLSSIALDNKNKSTMTNNNNGNMQTKGDAGKFGSMIYTIPKGWKVEKFPDGDILSPIEMPKGEFLQIWVQPSMNFSGSMEQALQKSYNETAEKMQATKMNDVNGGNYSKETAKISFCDWEYIRCSGGIHMGGGDYPPEYGLDLFVVKVNDRFERIAIIKSRNTCGGLTRYYPSDRLNYRNPIENFLFALQFSDWQEPTLKIGTVKGEGVIGVWQGISMSVGVERPGAELGAELKGKQLIFFSNGQAYFGTYFPVEGLDELNTWIASENNRRDWGAYTFNNGKGILKMPYGEIPLRIDNGKLIITTNKTDHGFIKLKPVDGVKINGTYILSEWNGMIPSVTFTADGKFTDRGAVRILYHEYTDCLNPAITPGSGTYEIKNHSLIFNYSDGRKIKIAVPGKGFADNNSNPSTLIISFNEDVLMKQ